MRQDVCGRANCIRRGDYAIAEARRLAYCYASEHGFLPQEQLGNYMGVLVAAEINYCAAGLGLLGGRVAFFARRVAQAGDRENVRDAWRKFDRLNAGGCGVT